MGGKERGASGGEGALVSYMRTAPRERGEDVQLSG